METNKSDKTREENPQEALEEKNDNVKIPFKKGGKWFEKIPKDILVSPSGIILVLIAFLIEVGDIIPIPILDQIWELPLEIIFIALFVFIAKPSVKSLIIPFILERIPLISDILPTWLIRILM